MPDTPPPDPYDIRALSASALGGVPTNDLAAELKARCDGFVLLMYHVRRPNYGYHVDKGGDPFRLLGLLEYALDEHKGQIKETTEGSEM